MSDQIHRFLFDDAPVRGEHVRLTDSYRELLAVHHYPPAVRELLGQFLAAASLLSATIKFDGILTLQARSEGEVPLIMAEATSEGDLRAIARDAGQAMSPDFGVLLHQGQLCITIQPRDGQRYQGIVELQGDNLAACLEQYFIRSEQLSTRLWLAADGEGAAGLLLQELPSQQPDRDFWQHACSLAETVTDQELLRLDAETLLYRLYHQETLRLFPPSPLRFRCSCNQQRLANALQSLGREELEDILLEQGKVEVNCEFCNRHYLFDKEAIASLFEPANTGRKH